MAAVYILILAAILLLVISTERNIYNPLTIFAGMWLFVGILSFLNLYQFNPVSDYAYWIGIIGVCCFTAGCWLRSTHKIWGSEIIGFNAGSYNTINYSFLLPFYTFILLFTALLASRSISLLLSGTHMETIRFNYSSIDSGIVVKTALEYDIEHYIVATAEFSGVALTPILLMDKMSVKKVVLLGEILLFFMLHIFVTGARSFLFDLVFVLVLYVLIEATIGRRFRKFFRKVPKVFIGAACVGATVLFIIMTLMRKGGVEVLLHEVYSYFAISFRLLETHLNLMQAEPDYTYGMTLLHGLLRPIFLVLRAGGIPYPAIYTKAIDAINANNTFYAVGRGSANSFVTVFYYFYMDFGFPGILAGSFLYGYFSQSVYKSMQARPDKRRQSIYLLVAVGLFLSFVRLHFTAPRYIYAFVLLFFSFRETKERGRLRAAAGVRTKIISGQTWS